MPHWNEQKSILSKESEGDDGTWAISYGDMITLLLAFFILFFSTDPEDKQEMDLLDAIVNTLSQTPDSKQDSTETAEEQFVSGENGQEEVNVGSKESLRDPGQQTIKDLQMEDVVVKTTQVNKKVFIEFPGVSFFRSGRKNLTKDGVDALSSFAHKFVPFAGTHVIHAIGFTDPEPVREGKPVADDNLELSVLRSLSAQRTLQKAGIPLHKTRLGGFGIFDRELAQIVDVDQKDRAYALSRKVVLVIEPEGKY